MTFGERLLAATGPSGGLCVGIDPHEHLLEAWGLPHSAAGAERFALTIVEAATRRVSVIKPQVAFFERYASDGYLALETVLAAAREAGLIVIADVKRGDLGTSVAAYGEAWLTPGSPLEVDAMTLNPFQGFGSLQPVLETAASHGKGAFVLCATSNPEAAATQQRMASDGESLAAAIERDADSWNQKHSSGTGSVGLVVGATVKPDAFGLQLHPGTPVLAPGFGHQGAKLASRRELFGPDTLVLSSVSRSITAGRTEVAAAIERSLSELNE